ncbi:c-type cytochrome [Maribacter sp. CXY002]|uniref:c-type cytochrome n=1 Tax=Maribacter luteocoastalis TaxID=3407671 RepID=UPI003B67C095
MYKRSHTFFFLGIFLVLFFSCKPDEKLEGNKTNTEIKFQIPDGFTLEEIYHPSKYDQGSWVALAKGNDNQMFACDQYGKIYTFQVSNNQTSLAPKDVVPLDLQIGEAHGLIWAFNSLYVAVNKRWDKDISDSEQAGSGIYRITDENKDGKLDTSRLLLKLEGSGEHGPHSFALSPNKKEIYFIAGNHTLIPDKVKENSRLPINWGEDNLFEPYLDARGHANDIKAPGGWVAKFNPEGTQWELFAAGFRNAFDIAFNEDGELFTYDADMEWDIGMPWYRPTRICHVTSGSEYGWRTGSGKWPAYYPDNLPAVHNLEQGSPTAVISSSGLNLPTKYSNGLFAMDWSFGTVYFISLKQNESSYTAEREVFLTGTPLPLTDMVAGSDGNLYFATGGRNLDSHLYRLSANDNYEVEKKHNSENHTQTLRELRHKLEVYHTKNGQDGIDLAWANLNHRDRFIRYAARLVLEHHPVDQWLNKFNAETDDNKVIEAAIAMSHQADKVAQNVILEKLQPIRLEVLNKEKQVDLLRAYSLNFIRMGYPNNSYQSKISNKLRGYFPHANTIVNKELAQLLLYLKTPGITEKLVAQLIHHTKNKTVTEGVEMLSGEATLRSEEYGPLIREVIDKMPPSEAIYYGMLLSNAKEGWSKQSRKSYFQWYYDVLSSKGGMSFKAYMENVRQCALNNIPENERNYFQEISGSYAPSSAIADLPLPKGPGKNYSGGDMGDIVWSGLDNYNGNYEDGERAFKAATCVLCHRIKGEGGAAGPDLTQAYSKFGTYDLMFAIYSPNDEISDQYANTLFHLRNGSKIAGRIKVETNDSIVLMPNPFNEMYTTTLVTENIVKRELSPISPMPSGLLNRLNKEEIIDLFAYLNSGGNKNHEIYTNSKNQ